MSKKIIYIMIVVSLFSSCNFDKELQLELLYQSTNLSIEELDYLSEKYYTHDVDYNILKNHKLFDVLPDLTVSKYFRVYSQIRTIEQGGRLADILCKMYYKEKFHRKEVKYKNMYIYYYYRNIDTNWKYVVILSEHTGEILYYCRSDNVFPVL